MTDILIIAAVCLVVIFCMRVIAYFCKIIGFVFRSMAAFVAFSLFLIISISMCGLGLYILIGGIIQAASPIT